MRQKTFSLVAWNSSFIVRYTFIMDLSDPFLKTSRAKEHLDALRKEMEPFYKSKPCEFQEKVNFKDGLYQVRIQVNDPPPRLSVIVGDVFGCLRASLDHLVWLLVTHHTDSYAEGTQFPILSQNGPDDIARFKKQIRGVPARAETIIESLQPYHGGNRAAIESNLLWRLNKLCNIDKHRRIPVHGSVVDFMLPDFIPKSMVTLDDDGVMSFPLHMKDQVKLHPDVAFNVIFGDSHEKIECDVAGIERIHEFVTNDVLPRFAGL
jgi:hypothetical protein